MNPPSSSTNNAHETVEDSSIRAVDAEDKKEVNVTGDHFSASANEEDKKRAAEDPKCETRLDDKNRTPNDSDFEGDDGNDGSSAESSSSDDEEVTEKSKEYFTDDGRKLSEYEIQRLERIKRNREYLAKLGLEGKEGGGVLGQKQRRQRSRKPNEVAQVVRRSSLSRRSKIKKVVTYAEPSASDRDLLRVADKKAANAPVDLKIPSPDKDSFSLQESNLPVENKRKPRKSVNDRQEAFIYLEFKRIQSSKKQLVKQASRNVRLAEKEVNYWHKLVGRWERRNQKQLDAERQRQAEARERVVLGGKSIKELLQELDRRFPEINAAIQRYDNDLQTQARKEYGDQLRAEAQEKVKMMDALDQFPIAMKNAASLLNTFFLERAPMDLPPLRRSRRSAFDEVLETISYPEKKLTTRAGGHEGRESENITTLPMQRKRGRNVGGWISPEFSDVIDRSWLSGDAPTKQFNLSNYVPQVGDTVLYYISGHKQFLAEYPDVLAKKAKIKSRIPLWERPAQIHSGDAEAANPWWTEKWLAGLESTGVGDFPLLCRVERTNIEFPPDPFSKVVKKDDEGSTKIYFKKPKNVTVDKAVSQLRLSVGLRPLTPLELPSLCTTASGPQPTALPPFFSVVTFPSNKLEPFLVPFGWAYGRAHSVTLNQKVLIRPGKDKTQFRIEEFIEHSGGSNLRLEENAELIKKTLHFFDSAPSRTAALEELLRQQPFGTEPLPLRDAWVILDVWSRRFNGCLFEQEGSSSEMPPFADLIRSTLPLWKSVKLLRNMQDTHHTWVSPWQVLAPGRERELSSPWCLGEQSYSLDEPLRGRIDSLLGEIVSEYQAAAEMFFEPVTEDIAPSYCCAVPLGMSLSRISQRLQLNGLGSNKNCYYRNVDAVLEDVASIFDNCLLYNSPDAEVVCEAKNLVALIKERIGKVTNEYYHELNEARKIDEERRRLELQRNQSIGRIRTLRPTGTLLDCLRKPFKEPLHREWLESMGRSSHQSHSLSSIRSVVDTKDTSACPQAGETVLYSLALHNRFVNGHFSSLEAAQCILPSLDVTDDASPPSQGEAQLECRSSEWMKGEIIWTHSAFPKMPVKQNKEYANTFSTMSTVLALGIKFQGSSFVSTVYWRPCLFYFDTGYAKGVCSGCGLTCRESFLRAGSGIGDTFVAENSLSTFRRMSICRCIDLLKRRCLKRTPPAFVDPLLTKEKVKMGYKVPQAKVGKSSLPVFSQLFESCGPTSTVSHHGTRGASLKSAKENPEVDVLKDAGFIPIWASSQTGGSTDDVLLQKAGTILPSPRLCLEQIQLRLQNDYYRCPAAIENDLAEAYLCAVTLMIYGAATRKKSPVSVRRVAYAVSSEKDMVIIGDNIDATVRDEEADLARRLQLVRDVYAAALVSVSHTDHAEQVFGLANSFQLKPVFKKAEDPDPDRVAARKKLAYIMRAISRDECLNSFGDAEDWGMPTIKLTVRCGGEPFSFDSRHFSVRSTPLEAKIYGNSFDVKVICGGEPTFFGNVSLFENISSNVYKKKYTVAPPIFFGPDIYEKNNSLSNLFFRRNGRVHACARCQAYKRSMLTCRVAKRHSNFDFDWLSWIPGGTNQINDLLKKLQSLNCDPVEENDEDSITGEGKTINNDNRSDVGEDDGQCHDDKSDPEDGEDNGDSEEKNSMKAADAKFGDPRACSNKAELTLQLSKEVLADITSFSEAPIRLSKEFIEKEFPVDEDDGHYLYCVICGLSGNLLCCDGCPVVVHPDCVGMVDLPAGDWYCEGCNMDKSEASRHKVSNNDAENKSHMPFDRLENASTKLDRVTSMLDALRSSRPTHHTKMKRTANEDDNDDDDDDDGASTVELSSTYRKKRLRRPSKADNYHSDDETEHHPPKRRRRRRQTGHDLAASSASRQPTITRTSLGGNRNKTTESPRNALEIRRLKPKHARNPFEILSETQKEFMLSIGIKTAEEFLATRTTDIAPKFVVWRRKNGLSKLKGSGPTASVSAWKTSVRNAIEAMAIESEDSDSETEEEDVETTESSVIEVEGDDPLEALSETTKSFLESIGITNAVAFLSQRSSDIAPHFVEWRADEGMSELKGSGPVASVSAWKTLVRTRAKEMGFDRVAELEPVIQNRQSMTPQKKPLKRHNASFTAQIRPTPRQQASSAPFVSAQTKAMKRQNAPATAHKKPSKRQHASATPPKIRAKKPLASTTLQRKIAKSPQASAAPRKKPAKRQHASASPKQKSARRSPVASTERPSQRNSVKRARRAHVNRSAVEREHGSDDQNKDLEVEESDSSSSNDRRTRRKSRPPRRFIEIQESLMGGKASKTLKGARTNS